MSQRAKRVWAVRHPEVVPFAGAVGHLELALCAPAATSAAKVRAALRGLGVCGLVSSPRRRCLEVARELARALALPLRVDERLRELEHGVWSGRTWDELEAWDRSRYHAWLRDWIHRGPPGGESARQLEARVAAALDETEPGWLWLTHRGPLQALLVLAGRSWSEAATWPCPFLEQPRSIFEVTVTAEGEVAVRREADDGGV